MSQKLRILFAAAVAVVGMALTPAIASANRTLSAGTELPSGTDIYASPGSPFHLAMQTDGNLVLYNGATAMWQSHTYNHPNSHGAFQVDGNLVVYDSTNHPVWWSGTNGNYNATLAVQDDGNMVIYSAPPNSHWLWQTNTVAHSYTELRNRASARCLDAAMNTIGNNGTKVQLWDCNGGENQRWTVDADGTIRSQASRRVLDANGGTLNINGTQVQLWDANGGRNQAWYAASPAVLPQVSDFTYCAPDTGPSNFGHFMAFKPCIRVRDAYDETTAATRSTPSGSACPNYTFTSNGVGTESLACNVAGTGSYWNGTSNIDYVTMHVTWTSIVVQFVPGGTDFTTTLHETDDDTITVATFPNGHRTRSVSTQVVDYGYM